MRGHFGVNLELTGHIISFACTGTTSGFPHEELESSAREGEYHGIWNTMFSWSRKSTDG